MYDKFIRTLSLALLSGSRAFSSCDINNGRAEKIADPYLDQKLQMRQHRRMLAAGDQRPPRRSAQPQQLPRGLQKPRLQALPFAKNCIRCQALLERRQ